MTTQQPQGYPSLTKSYKGIYPFKIGTTSFIYPDHYIPNVKMLGPYMDEIELLLFESTGPDALPSRSVITELGRLAAEFDLSYNIHLPTDISISDRDPARQRHAVETMVWVIERVHPLCPSALTLHIPYAEGSFEEYDVKKWQDRVYHNLDKILSATLQKDIIAIENLNYPFELVEEIIIDLDLSICLDLGHLMLYDYDIVSGFNKYSFKTSIIHLHGVEKARDHTALYRLPDKLIESVLWILKRFTGVVSLEVFSFENLNSSLIFLENQWEKNSA
jgi:sugar phosphate isomerase/epimerase